MTVVVLGVGRLLSETAGPVQGFRPRQLLPERKHLKLMGRAVRLGVAAVGAAVEAAGGLHVPPPRRGLWVGTRVQPGASQDLTPLVEAAEAGGVRALCAAHEQLHPLWLVKGLTNNVAGFATAYHDLQGPSVTCCEGRVSGLSAVLAALRALRAGTVDVAVAGAADSPLLPGVEAAEGAVFFVLARSGPGPQLLGGEVALAPAPSSQFGPEVGAVSGLPALAAAAAAGRACEVVVGDPRGLRATVRLAAGPCVPLVTLP